jgi:hypothetical protein
MGLWIILIFIAICAICWAAGLIAKMLTTYKEAKIQNIRKLYQETQIALKKIENDRIQNQLDHESVIKLAKEKSLGFPWLAEAYSEYFHLVNIKIADDLETKPHPAIVSADRVREIARDRRIIEKKLRIAQEIIKYYQNLFPFLEDFVGEIEDEVLKQILNRNITAPLQDIIDIDIDPVRLYLSSMPDEQYYKLSDIEKNQLALDRYWNRTNKTKWQIGRDYERYIGYLYESEGYNVYYQGILEGFNDLGRDLITKNGNDTTIVQCKCWSQHKVIHEKHINQLFGTMIKYTIDNPNEEVRASLVTSTSLSDRAKEFANHLGITFLENFPIKIYPSIKCNISKRNGAKIYHLPFDQQYDRVIIEEEKSECYVEKVEEAEYLGFRRAWKWRGTITD